MEQTVSNPDGSAQTVESLGPTVEEAIEAGLARLGRRRDEVEVEILDRGSRGLLGIGARPARVRLTYHPPAPPPPPPEPPEEPESLAEAPAPAVAPPPPTLAPSREQEAEVARQVLEELLEKMGIRARIEVHYPEPEAGEAEAPPFILNVRGKDLGSLIGRRGETLQALQYIPRLIVGRELERRVALVVDVEGYRQRRERSLRRLAQRMAERVVRTGRRVVLEPMPPAERRIIHLALRDHPQVTTESIGQGDRRKVTIFLRPDRPSQPSE